VSDKIDTSPDALDPQCAKCGHKRSEHHYRHPFVGPSQQDTIADLQKKLTEVIKKWSAAESEAYDLRAAIPRVYQMALDAASVYCEKLDLGWKDRAGLQVYPSATYCAVAIRALTPPADLVQQATKGTDHE